MIITALMVRKLREKTGAGMMDCKRALVEVHADFEKAVDLLRTKGLALAAKKAHRVAVEGLTAIVINGNKGAVVEINSETDFISRNQKFQELVHLVAQNSVHHNNIESLKVSILPSGQTVQECIVNSIATIGENLTLRRMQTLEVNRGVIASYTHNAVAEGMGQISVLVALESETSNKVKLEEVGKQIAMHIAASKPYSLNAQGLDPTLVAREKAIFLAQSKASGKPDHIIQKMMDGRISKFFEESVLLDQIFILDAKTTVSSVIQQLTRELGTLVEIKGFIRFETGEGIEV